MMINERYFYLKTTTQNTPSNQTNYKDCCCFCEYNNFLCKPSTLKFSVTLNQVFHPPPF